MPTKENGLSYKVALNEFEGMTLVVVMMENGMVPRCSITRMAVNTKQQDGDLAAQDPHRLKDLSSQGEIEIVKDSRSIVVRGVRTSLMRAKETFLQRGQPWGR